MDTMIANQIYAVITPFMKADVLAVTIALIMYFVIKRIIIIKQIVAVKYYCDVYKAMLDSITKRFVIDLPIIDDSLNLPAEPIDDKTSPRTCRDAIVPCICRIKGMCTV